MQEWASCFGCKKTSCFRELPHYAQPDSVPASCLFRVPVLCQWHRQHSLRACCARRSRSLCPLSLWSLLQNWWITVSPDSPHWLSLVSPGLDAYLHLPEFLRTVRHSRASLLAAQPCVRTSYTRLLRRVFVLFQQLGSDSSTTQLDRSQHLS